ncbi:MAG TPA: helicase-related protein, partial [Elusimicrobiales bacterium]|nr:helicase-related protein [Elusimicrobiales bacterium]
AELRKLMPNLRAASIHGQMKAEEVEERMWDFLNRKYDLLLASTIIESGIDIPSVNTLIVENAHELGLAQLYQLRGRIGREKQKAFCWLFFPGWMKPKTAAEAAKEAEGKKKKGKPDPAEEKRRRRAEGWGLEESFEAAVIKERPPAAMTEDAMKRLSALEEFTELGSGFRLAMRDLEIRGAGELLGVRQHGFINTIGLDMYIKLLNSEIARLRGKAEEELAETAIDLSLPAYIPEDYVGDDMERLNFYKKLLNAPAGRVEAVIAEFEDISGPAPQPLRNLAGIIRFKKTLSAHGVRSVAQKGDTIEIFFHPRSPVDAAIIGSWHKFFGDRLGFIPSRFGDGVRIAGVSDPLADVGRAVAAFPEKKK